VKITLSRPEKVWKK
jgi:hypothetical protein